MGMRYRKSIKLLPGVRLNLNKKSASISFGTKGLRHTISTTGKSHTTIGIPGTGISYTTSGGSSRKSSCTSSQAVQPASTSNRFGGKIALGIFLLLVGGSRVYTGWMEGNLYFLILGIAGVLVGAVVLGKVIEQKEYAADQCNEPESLNSPPPLLPLDEQILADPEFSPAPRKRFPIGRIVLPAVIVCFIATVISSGYWQPPEYLTADAGSYTRDQIADTIVRDPNAGSPVQSAFSEDSAVYYEETSEPEPVTTVTYVGNSSTKKYHRSTCSSVEKMNAENKVYFTSSSSAVSSGYEACKKCNP